jgi:hypothetical protein
MAVAGPVETVPEPSSLALCGSGLLASAPAPAPQAGNEATSLQELTLHP